MTFTDTRIWRWFQYVQAVFWLWAIGLSAVVTAIVRALDKNLTWPWLLLIAVGTACLVLAGLLTFLGRRTPVHAPSFGKTYNVPQRPPATPQELAQQHIADRTVRIVDLITDGVVIKDRTIERCTLVGPAVVGFLSGMASGLGFDVDDPETLFLLVEEGRYVKGAIGIQDTIIRDCDFENIGIVGTAEVIDQIRQEFAKGKDVAGARTGMD